MKARGISAVVGHGLCVFAFLCCACGSSQSSGVTNPQPQNSPNLAPGACIQKGDACVHSHDCCSQWCANGMCATKTS